MGRQITVEVCLDSLASAVIVKDIAGEFGGRVKWRIELCSNLIHGGGLTPSIGLVRSIHTLLPEIDIMVMIRPRIGNFVYSELDVRSMYEDILAMKEEGVAGFAAGCLLPNGDIDTPTLQTLCSAAGHLPITFHRAFDVISVDPLEAISYLAKRAETANVTRILTSGQAQTAPEGIEVIKALVKNTSVTGGPKILPGSGLNGLNLPGFLAHIPEVTEIHLTASEIVGDGQPKALQEKSLKMGFGGYHLWMMSKEKLRAVFKVIDDLGQE